MDYEHNKLTEKDSNQFLAAPVGSADGAGSPASGSQWHMMTPDRRYLHCHLIVRNVEHQDNGPHVKYYAQGKQREVECLTPLHEWCDLVKSGRIRKANDPALPTASANL